MDTMFESLKRQFATELHKLGMFRDKTKSPDGKGFLLKLHQTEPDAPLSPYYIDLRILRSYPNTAKRTAMKLFEEMIKGFAYDVLADVPTGITPVVSSLSDRLDTPMITPRAPKSHGGGGSIDGTCSEGDIALLFDDIITGAHSKIEAVQVLRAGGIEVRNVFVLLDREQGGREQLKTEGLALHSAFTISELLWLYRDEGVISASLHDEIRGYQQATR